MWILRARERAQTSAAPPRRISSIARGNRRPEEFLLGGRPVRDAAGHSDRGAAAARVLRSSPAGCYSDAISTPDVGLYLEMPGAIIVIVASGAGLLLLGSSRSETRVSAS